MDQLLDLQNTLNQLGQIFSQKVTIYIDDMVESKLKEMMIKPQQAQIQKPVINFKQEESFTLQEKQNNENQLQQVQEQIAKKKRQQKKRESKNKKLAKESIEINVEEEKEQKVVKQKKHRTVYNVYIKERAKQLAHLPPGIRKQQCISDWKSLTEAEKYVYFQMLQKDLIQVKKERKDQKQINQFFQNQSEQKKIQI